MSRTGSSNTPSIWQGDCPECGQHFGGVFRARASTTLATGKRVIRVRCTACATIFLARKVENHVGYDRDDDDGADGADAADGDDHD